MSNPVVKIGNFTSAASPSSKRESLGLDAFASDNFAVYGNDGALNSDGRSAPLIMAQPIGKVSVGGGNANDEKLKPWIGDEVYKDNTSKEPSCYATANKSIHAAYVLPNLNVGNGIQTTRISSCLNTICKGLVNWDVKDGDDYTNVTIGDSTFTVSENDLYLYLTAKAYRSKDWEGKITLTLNHNVFGRIGDGSINLAEGFGFLFDVVPATLIRAGMDGDGAMSITATQGGNNTSPDFNMVLKTGDIEIWCNSTSQLQVKIKGGDETAYSIPFADVRAKSAIQQTAAGNGLNTICFLPCWNGVLAEVQGFHNYVCRKYSNKSPSYYIMQKTGEIKQGDGDIQLDPIRLPDTDGSENFYPDFGTQFELELRNCVASFAIVPLIFAKGQFDSWHLLATNADSDATYKYETVSITSGVDAEKGSFTTTDEQDESTGLWWSKNPFDLSVSKAEIYGQVIKTVVNAKDHYLNSNGTFNLTASGSDKQGESSDWKQYVTSVQTTCGLQNSSGSITVDGLGYAGTGIALTQSIGGISISVSGGNHTHGGTIFNGLAMGVGVNSSTTGTELSIPLVGVEKKLQDMALINPPFLDGWTLNKACRYLFGYAGIAHSMRGSGSTRLSATTEMTKAIFDWKSGTTVEQALNDVMLDTHHTYAIIDGKAVIYELGDDGLPTSLGSNRQDNRNYTEIAAYDQTPDFEDLRNYCVGMGIVAQPGGTDNAISYMPIIKVDRNHTTPSIPWAKIWAQARPGYTSAHASGDYDGSLDEFVDNMKKACKKYHLTGKVSVAGDARIKPYDKWGEYVIYSVSHNVDLQSKQWTTSFELMRSGGGSHQGGPGGGGI